MQVLVVGAERDAVDRVVAALRDRAVPTAGDVLSTGAITPRDVEIVVLISDQPEDAQRAYQAITAQGGSIVVLAREAVDHGTLLRDVGVDDVVGPALNWMDSLACRVQRIRVTRLEDGRTSVVICGYRYDRLAMGFRDRHGRVVVTLPIQHHLLFWEFTRIAIRVKHGQAELADVRLRRHEVEDLLTRNGLSGLGPDRARQIYHELAQRVNGAIGQPILVGDLRHGVYLDPELIEGSV